MPTTAIEEKHSDLKEKGLDLGAAEGAETRLDDGGRVQRYEHGHIYWRTDLGAHEVHGAILAEYLRLGGPGPEPTISRTLLGYPTSDEGLSPDGAGRQSRFETGTILYSTDAGAHAVHGPLYGAWQRRADDLGHPLCRAMATAASHEILFCRGGAVITTGPANRGAVLRYVGPLLGNATIVTPDSLAFDLYRTADVLGRPQFSADAFAWMEAAAPNFVAAACAGRIALRKVGGTDTVPLEIAQTVYSDTFGSKGIKVSARLPAGLRLADRTLYDLIVVPPSGPAVVMSPHCFYAKADWSRFGAMHATDIHVSRRLDGFWRKLGRLGRTESQAEFINWNESFRKLVREANRLHAIGALDVIIATGDLVDYQVEKGEQTHAASNFLLFENIIRGLSPSPEGRVVQALRVPIFTTLGNHDYRVLPYALYFKVVSDVIHEGQHFASMNLTTKDAYSLQGDRKLNLSSGEALDMVRKTAMPPYYARRINREDDSQGTNSYLVRLGPHRLVMIDSGPDIGGPDSELSSLWQELAGDDEDYDVAKSGSPNLQGILPDHRALLTDALDQAGDALVVVGIHGPPLNIRGSRFEDAFRETTHPTTDEADLVSFLSLAERETTEGLLWQWSAGSPLGRLPLDGNSFARFREKLGKTALQRHPAWMKSAGKRYFMYGTTEDMLDEGACKGEIDAFLHLCAGGGDAPAARGADLVLCGHGHDAVEFRVESKPSGLRFYTDFYTRTPAAYYDTIRLGSDAGLSRIAVVPSEGAAPGAPPVRATGDDGWSGDEWRQTVPPYGDPLDRSPDPAGWWKRHRPVVMQTGAAGPIESRSNTRRIEGKTRPDASFRGYRLISVAGNAIQNIHYRFMADIVDVARPRAEWEIWEGATIRLRSKWKPEVSLVFGTEPPVNARERDDGAGTPGDTARDARPPRAGQGPRVPRGLPTLPLGGAGPVVSGADQGTGRWKLEPLGNRAFRIREAENDGGRCLHIENGALQRGHVEPGWLSAGWTFEPTDGSAWRIRNRWKPDHCIHIEGGRPAAGPVQPGWLSAMWHVEFFV